jgi:hypothetical protein
MDEVARITVEVAGGILTVSAPPRVFSTGSRGYYGNGKVQAPDGTRYQVGINIVEVGSRPGSKPVARTPAGTRRNGATEAITPAMLQEAMALLERAGKSAKAK